mmetsp:Transcript_3347/g.4549  ORF Transcript_3347/g.4549 Transcript_3347/m.4549 type:complete len:243 (-) Transcript_3347:149-877(-)
MCTTGKFFITNACAYTETDEDGENSMGCVYAICNSNYCTKNKTTASDDQGSYEVIIPPIEDLSFRTACLCQYCGFSCKPEHHPCGVTSELGVFCLRSSLGCQLMTGETKKRGCMISNCVANCLTCEEPSVNNNEFIVLEESCLGMMYCCISSGCSAKLSCCPSPIVCVGSQGQTCCLYGRTNLPCNDTTPMELGCCGVMCIDKSEGIAKAEAEIREKKEQNSSNTIEATIVENKGANKMERV